MRYGEAPGYYNKKCERGKQRADRPRVRKKYGIAGYIYDGYKSGDIFKKRDIK
jgi:hypothetical protein